MDRERSSLNLLPKRRRDSEYDNERRRKAGRLAAGPGAGAGVGPSSIASSNRLEVPAARSRTTPDEDIFGSRAASVAPSLASHGDGKKRAPDSQQAVANKAVS
jgi:hypothetical protein